MRNLFCAIIVFGFWFLNFIFLFNVSNAVAEDMGGGAKCNAAALVQPLCTEEVYVKALPESLLGYNSLFTDAQRHFMVEMASPVPAGTNAQANYLLERAKAEASVQFTSIQRCEAAVDHCKQKCGTHKACTDSGFIALQKARLIESRKTAEGAGATIQATQSTPINED